MEEEKKKSFDKRKNISEKSDSADKKDFLEYLRDKSNYQIEEKSNAKYSFSNFDKTAYKTKIISLEPAPFTNEPVK